MSKRLILLLGIMTILSVSFVFAINEGQVFNQNQLDNQNISNIDLECQYHGFNVVYDHGNPEKIVYELSCLDMKRHLNDDGTESGNYVVYRKHFTAVITVSRFIECIEVYGTQTCLDEYIPSVVVNVARAEKNYIRANARSLQTPTDLSQVNFDINITELI